MAVFSDFLLYFFIVFPSSGAMSYSKEDGHDNLSVFYVDSLPVDGGIDGSNIKELMNMFRLYNIQYLVFSKSYHSIFVDEHQVKFKVKKEIWWDLFWNHKPTSSLLQFKISKRH